jgi:hypothetical protein
MTQRFVTIELTQDECDALHDLCEIVTVALMDSGIASSLTKSQKENIRTRVNAVRYKAGAASQLFAGGQIITDPVGMMALDAAKRNRRN